MKSFIGFCTPELLINFFIKNYRGQKVLSVIFIADRIGDYLG